MRTSEADIPVHDFPGDAGAPTVVCIHDFTAGGRWFGQLAEACDGRVHLIAPDLRGRVDAHAMAPAGSLAGHVADIEDVIATTGVSCTLVGHGTGAALAWMTALIGPASVHALILLDGPVAPNDATGQDWIAAAARVDPGVGRLRGTYPHRDRLITEGITTGRFPAAGMSRALRRAADSEVSGSGFAWRPRLGAAALQQDWRQFASWQPPAGRPAVPVCAVASRHGHRIDDPPLALIKQPWLEWRRLATTHSGLLWDPMAVEAISDIIVEATIR